MYAMRPIRNTDDPATGSSSSKRNNNSGCFVGTSEHANDDHNNTATTNSNNYYNKNNKNNNNNNNFSFDDKNDNGRNSNSNVFRNWLPNVVLSSRTSTEDEPSTSSTGRSIFQSPFTNSSGNNPTNDGPGNTFAGVTSDVLLATIGEQCASTWRWFRSWALRIDGEENCSNPGDEQGITESSIRISHSLPDLNHEEEQTENTAPSEPTVKESKKVFRQITLPSVPTRHQTFQRQLSHRVDFEGVEFKICKIKPRNQYIGEVKPELYSKELIRQPSTDSSENENMQYCGKLYFSLRYDFELDALIIKVLEAHDLPVKDVLGSSDPYVKVFLLPDRKKKFQTKVHRKNLDPVFNETFIVSVGYDELRKRHLQFSVYDFDRFSRHDLIGQVMLKNLFNGTDLTQEIEYTMNIMCPPEDKQHLGEIMLSLCYLPTAGRLTVTVVKARHLKAMDITGSSDPYVKVYLICGNKRIRKKRTTVKRSTLNPVYNEALTFDVPSTNIEDVSLLVKVVDYDRIGSDELMGYVGIGTNVVGTGKDHWLDMLDNPRNPVAQWYTLTDTEPGPVPTSDSVRFNCLTRRRILAKRMMKIFEGIKDRTAAPWDITKKINNTLSYFLAHHRLFMYVVFIIPHKSL